MMGIAALESPEDFGMVGCIFGVTGGIGGVIVVERI
jgi:hypothetical protein